MVTDQLQTLLDEIDAIDPFQSGFKLCHGMETALSALQDDLLRDADRVLNLSVAFNTINHNILLGRDLGIRCWPWSFLDDCPQRVQLGEMVSNPWTLCCGSPAGVECDGQLSEHYCRSGQSSDMGANDMTGGAEPGK